MDGPPLNQRIKLGRLCPSSDICKLCILCVSVEIKRKYIYIYFELSFYFLPHRSESPKAEVGISTVSSTPERDSSDKSNDIGKS